MVTATISSNDQKRLIFFLFSTVGVYSGILLFPLRTYIQWQSVNLILGTMVLFICGNADRSRKGGLRFGYFSLLLSVIGILLPVKTILYFSLSFAILFSIETFYGRLDWLPALTIVFMSPIFQFFTNVFSFSLRLQLTSIAGEILNGIGFACTVNGNLIQYKEYEFAVDRECMGLNMMITSLLVVVMLIGVFQRRYKKRLDLHIIGIALTMALALNIFSNVFRIISLVWFVIMPENIMHDIVGILCLVVYVVVPSTVGIRFLVSRYGRPYTTTESEPLAITSLRKVIAIHLSILVFMIVCSSNLHKMETTSTRTMEATKVEGYDLQPLSDDIVKMKSENALVYVKGIPAFYNSDHSPMICWKGSGYEIGKINEQIFGATKVYTAVLQNGNDRLYTAWWYDNGYHQTIDQLTWRWNNLRDGKRYSIVNVTTETEEQLQVQVVAVRNLNALRRLLLD